jgi:hypothetical protein
VIVVHPVLRTASRSGGVLAAILVLIAASQAHAQAAGGTVWEEAWSPIAPVGDLVHEVPSTVRFPRLLTAPSPRSGLHWTVGNPAGLAWELDRARQDFTVRQAATDGEYRRPLDPANASLREAGGLAWEPLEGSGALVGRIGVVQRRLGEGTLANTAFPYSSSPHVVMDTSGAALRQSVARLEGAGGWRMGGWGVGLALGYETLATRSDGAAVARSFRFTRPAVTGGVARALGPVAIGVHGRWQGGSQTTQLAPRSGLGILRVYPIEGLTEPRNIDLDQGFYHRRNQRSATAIGGGATGTMGGMRWALFGERIGFREEQTSEQANEPELDVWDASGTRVGGAFDTALGEAMSVALDLRYTRLSGEAVRAEFAEEGILYDAAESRFVGSADIRFTPGRGWSTAARIALDRTERVRNDAVARLETELVGWTYGTAVEIARELPGAFALSGGAALTRYVPIGNLPDPGFAGPAFQTHVAPAYMLEGTAATATAASLTLAWQPASALGTWVRGEFGATSPPDFVSLPSVPSGERNHWEVTVGVRLR